MLPYPGCNLGSYLDAKTAIISSHANPSQFRDSLEAGAAGYLVKPYMKVELLNTVWRWKETNIISLLRPKKLTPLTRLCVSISLAPKLSDRFRTI